MNVLVRRLIKRVFLRWSTLRALGQNRVIRTSFFWIVLVPIFAKLLRPIAGSHTIFAAGKEWSIDIGLPFSWAAFYFSSVCFAIAQAIYLIRCPSLIDQYSNSADFLAQHALSSGAELGKRSGSLDREVISHVARWGFDTSPDTASSISEKLARQGDALYQLFVTHGREYLYDLTGGKSTPRDAPRMLAKLVMRNDPEDKDHSLRFWWLHNFADKVRPRSILASLTFFLMGFLCFLSVTLEGLQSVIRILL